MVPWPGEPNLINFARSPASSKKASLKPNLIIYGNLVVGRSTSFHISPPACNYSGKIVSDTRAAFLTCITYQINTSSCTVFPSSVIIVPQKTPQTNAIYGKLNWYSDRATQLIVERRFFAPGRLHLSRVQAEKCVRRSTVLWNDDDYVCTFTVFRRLEIAMMINQILFAYYY